MCECERVFPYPSLRGTPCPPVCSAPEACGRVRMHVRMHVRIRNAHTRAMPLFHTATGRGLTLTDGHQRMPHEHQPDLGHQTQALGGQGWGNSGGYVHWE